jgi:hypothetical protein
VLTCLHPTSTTGAATLAARNAGSRPVLRRMRESAHLFASDEHDGRGHLGGTQCGQQASFEVQEGLGAVHGVGQDHRVRR